MIDLLSSQARIAWTYASTDGKEHIALGGAAIVISSLAYSIFGKKALFVSACVLYVAFYFRKSFSNNSASLISAVISLPLFGFIHPLSAIPSAIYLCYYVLKHEHDQQEETLKLKEATERLKKIESKMKLPDLTDLDKTLESSNKIMTEILPSREELESLQQELASLLEIVEKSLKLYENQP